MKVIGSFFFKHCVVDRHAGPAADCAILIIDRNAAHRSVYHIVITLFIRVWPIGMANHSFFSAVIQNALVAFKLFWRKFIPVFREGDCNVEL